MAVLVENVLVWGAGGHGKVVADLVRATGNRIVGFIDRDPAKLGRIVEAGGTRVTVSEIRFLDEIRASGVYPNGIDAVVVAIGNNGARLGCLHALGDLSISTLVHPSAVVSPSARIGRGVVVFPRAVVNADAQVEDAAIINSGAIVEHDCIVGIAAHVSPAATLAGGVLVGERSWIGAGATIIPGVRIGADVIVGAGAVVIRNVADGVTVVGNPGRII